jgi:serine protease
MRKALVLVIVFCATSSLVTTAYMRSGINWSSKTSDAPVTDGPDDRYIIEFHEQGQGASEVRNAGGEVLIDIPRFKIVAARLKEKSLEKIKNNPKVKHFEPDSRRYPLTLHPVQSSETVPYGISMVEADQLPAGDSSVHNRKVCIIDSGFYRNHEDLQDSFVTASADNGSGDPFIDIQGHGTHVAGTIAALKNGRGVLGAMPGGTLNIHIVKVFGDTGNWTYSSNLINALGKCVDAGANVVNLSLGGLRRSLQEERAFNDAFSKGLLLIAAAGNDGDTALNYPAGYGSVISVGAIDQNRNLATFSNRNSDVELVAPGVDVLSTIPFKETNTLTVGSIVYNGNHIEFSARTTGLTGELVDGGLCSATSGAWSGKLVICKRGDISFNDKVKNVQSSGGIAALIYNNEPGELHATLGDGNTSTIPAISFSQLDGNSLLSRLGQPGTLFSQRQDFVSEYGNNSGTSMSTPHVSGVAALIWSYNPSWTNLQIRNALQTSALDLGSAGRDSLYGFGLVRAKAALDSLQAGGGADTSPPVISNVSSAKINGKGNFEIKWLTNEPANSEVKFVSGFTTTSTDPTRVTSHRMTFKGKAGTLYQYYVSSTDAAGNRSTSGPFTHQN